jgi:uncharacterized protein involved in exopolysaccharide biosynthesis
MDLYTFVIVVLRHWWLITLAIVLTTGSAAYTLSVQTPIYEATALVLLKPSPSLTDPNEVINAQNSLERRPLINSLARRAMASSMHERAATTLNIAPAVAETIELSAIVVPDTNIIEIRARSADAGLAAAVTNAVAVELQQEVPQQILAMDVIDPAVPPLIPIEPQPVRTMTLAAAFGLALGIAFALLNHVVRAVRAKSRGEPAPAPVSEDEERQQTPAQGSRAEPLDEGPDGRAALATRTP